MEITYAGLSSVGPVRANNEDCLDFWEPGSPEEWRNRGAVVILADGCGGHGHGEVASHLAWKQCVKGFTEGKAGSSANQFLWQMFTSANVAVYDEGMKNRMEGRMLTTLTVSIFRNNQ